MDTTLEMKLICLLGIEKNLMLHDVNDERTVVPEET